MMELHAIPFSYVDENSQTGMFFLMLFILYHSVFEHNMDIFLIIHLV